MDLSRIIIKPLLTEKTHLLKQGEVPKYAFVVDKKATKLHIKMAFEAIFGVSPESVNTILRKPKPTRHTNAKKRGYTKLMKIAYVTLPKGVNLHLDEDGVVEEEKKEEAEVK